MTPKTYYTTLADLLTAYNEFKSHPNQAYQLSHVWPPETWTWQEFHTWFVTCLHNKINCNDNRSGRCLNLGYQLALSIDRRVIQDHLYRRIHRPGTCNLRTLEMQRRYPHINNQSRED